ncbi:MFS transporter [Pandoraea terrae]|uniref:MFS transporter n=2 Tax=Pandoraea terrae TaxID=1537710 RepID=A0A5E4VE54_9BURK|nr:MFS transporter [Pandoraea terrae]VVE09689.1 MFS transporter [Pandoraea terrae]
MPLALTSHGPDGRAAPSRKTQLVATVLGNAMEWYDFMVFAFMTPIINRLFFPSSADASPLNSILLTTALFGAGFIMRPVGGIVLGMYGDRKGRKAAMMLGMSIMIVSVILMTFAPTYATAGIAAPIIVLISRLLQGFSVGGEFGTSTAFLIELAPPGKTGFYGSLQIAGQLLAQVFGASLGILLTTAFTPDQMDAGAWRIPFAIGLAIVPITFFMRRNMHESQAFVREVTEEELPGNGSPAHQSIGSFFIGMGMVAASAVSFYVTFGYTVTYAKEVLHIPMHQSFLVQTLAAIVMMLVVPAAGMLSDRFNRKKLLLASLGGYLAVVYPLYVWVGAEPSFQRLLVTQLVMGVLSAIFLGVYCTVLVELYAVRLRATSLAIVNNLAVMVFGGFSQFFVTWLLRITGSPMAPIFYVILGLVIGLVAVAFLPERHSYIAIRTGRHAAHP